MRIVYLVVLLSGAAWGQWDGFGAQTGQGLLGERRITGGVRSGEESHLATGITSWALVPGDCRRPCAP
jgi:hypothetical protein